MKNGEIITVYYAGPREFGSQRVHIPADGDRLATLYAEIERQNSLGRYVVAVRMCFQDFVINADGIYAVPDSFDVWGAARDASEALTANPEERKKLTEDVQAMAGVTRDQAQRAVDLFLVSYRDPAVPADLDEIVELAKVL